MDEAPRRWHIRPVPFTSPIERVSFVAIDIEATGIAPGYDRITELAAVRFEIDGDGAVRPGPVFDTLVNPGRPIPQVIAHMTGICDDDVADAPPLDEVWGPFHDFLEGSDRPTVLLAHNGKSDLAYLVADGDVIGQSWQGPPLACTLQITRRTLPDAPRHRLDTLVKWLGLDGEQTVYHRALADALHARNIFARCVSRAEGDTLADLGAPAPVDVPPPEAFHVSVPERLQPLEPLIEDGTTVAIEYRGGSKGRGPRKVTPLTFFRSDGVLFLRAWCHVDDEAKSFRCDRIRRFRPRTLTGFEDRSAHT